MKSLLRTAVPGETLIKMMGTALKRFLPMTAIPGIPVKATLKKAIPKKAVRTKVLRTRVPETTRGATVVRKNVFKTRHYLCGVVFGGLALSCLVSAHSAVSTAPLDLAITEIAASGERVEDLRLVSYFFSAEAWGGLPFTEAQKQQVMIDAMLGRSLVRMELKVTHLLSAPEARVRVFTAVYEIDGREASPILRAGYELELLVPHSQTPLSVELINAETGVINLVEVAPEAL